MVTRLGHRPGLDGLRGLAVLFVMAAHAGIPGFSLGGAVGVEVFFVLSGFLITTLLLERPVELRSFYTRRARRLLPALVVLLAFGGVVAAVMGDGATLAGVGAGATYVSNLARTQSVDLGWLNHLWSLAVEEHFYLVWPLVVLACRGRDRLVGWSAGVGMVASLMWRWMLVADGASWDRIYNGTDTRIVGILAGALLAVLVRAGLRAPVTVAGLGAIAVLLLGSVVRTDPFGFGFLAVDLATAVAIVGVVSGSTVGLGWRPLRWVGGVSYAAYLWHVPIMDALGDLEHLSPVQTAAGFAVTAGVSWLSMRLVEARWRSGGGVVVSDTSPAQRGGVHSDPADRTVEIPAIL